jgi:hypothetical protein
VGAEADRTNAGGPSAGGRIAVVAGFVLQLAMGAVILVSGLIMPIWAVAVLGAVWVLATVHQVRSRTRPGMVLAIPFALLAVWLLSAWAGDAFLDWTA